MTRTGAAVVGGASSAKVQDAIRELVDALRGDAATWRTSSRSRSRTCCAGTRASCSTRAPRRRRRRRVVRRAFLDRRLAKRYRAQAASLVERLQPVGAEVAERGVAEARVGVGISVGEPCRPIGRRRRRSGSDVRTVASASAARSACRGEAEVLKLDDSASARTAAARRARSARRRTTGSRQTKTARRRPTPRARAAPLPQRHRRSRVRGLDHLVNLPVGEAFLLPLHPRGHRLSRRAVSKSSFSASGADGAACPS